MKLHLITVAMVLYGYLSLVMPVTEAARPFKREAATKSGLDNAVAGPLKPKIAIYKQRILLLPKEDNFCSFTIKADLKGVDVIAAGGGNTIVIWPGIKDGVIIEADPKQVHARNLGGRGVNVVVIWPEVAASCKFTIKADPTDVDRGADVGMTIITEPDTDGDNISDEHNDVHQWIGGNMTITWP